MHQLKFLNYPLIMITNQPNARKKNKKKFINKLNNKLNFFY